MKRINDAVEQAIAEAITFRLNPVPWIGGDNRTQHDITTMSDSHIVNTMWLLEHGPMNRQGCSSLSNEEWLNVFRNEYTLRLLYPAFRPARPS